MFSIVYIYYAIKALNKMCDRSILTVCVCTCTFCAIVYKVSFPNIRSEFKFLILFLLFKTEKLYDFFSSLSLH